MNFHIWNNNHFATKPHHVLFLLNYICLITLKLQSFMKKLSEFDFRIFNYCFCLTSNSLCLSCVFLGLVLRFIPQQGQLVPFQLIKIAQTEQRFCPDAYLLFINGFFALYLLQIPLHPMISFWNNCAISSVWFIILI